MKKFVTFYQDGKSVFCVSRNGKKYGFARCGKTDNFNVIFGMKLSFFRMIARPQELTLYWNPVRNADIIGTAIVSIDDNAVMNCYYEHGFNCGYECKSNGIDKRLPRGESFEEYFVGKRGLIRITFYDE